MSLTIFYSLFHNRISFVLKKILIGQMTIIKNQEVKSMIISINTPSINQAEYIIFNLPLSAMSLKGLVDGIEMREEERQRIQQPIIMKSLRISKKSYQNLSPSLNLLKDNPFKVIAKAITARQLTSHTYKLTKTISLQPRMSFSNRYLILKR